MTAKVDKYKHPLKEHPDVLRIILPAGETLTASYGPSSKSKNKSYFVTSFTTGLLKVTLSTNPKKPEIHYLYPGYSYGRPISKDVTITIENIGGTLIGIFKS